MIGKTLAHYEITEKIGAGGMGEVYRARDTRLERDVALKVLPADATARPDRLARFEREAKTVAGLNHPSIVTLFSIEDDGDTRFLTMELIDGEPLDRLVQPGGLPLERVMELVLPLLAALRAAHERGVVHRDLKPSNVMVTRDGRVKVLDFGLAKLVEDEAGEHTQAYTTPVSTAGEVIGTVPYMAPEQLRGEPLDTRTDLFAVGVLLYELLTGRRPFPGKTAAEVSSAILRDAPAPTRRHRGDLPPEVNRILERCLQKDPEQRAQTAQEVRNDLEALRRRMETGTLSAGAPTPTSSAPSAGPAPPGGDLPSVAVLPFHNRSRDEEDEYFADGLSDELINVLAKIRGLRVAARTSCFRFKDKNEDAAVIGEKLKVSTLLEGSVRRSGDRLRVAVQLVNVSDGFHLWSETYDRTLDDIFAVQDDVAQSVVKELRRMLLGEDPDSDASDRVRAEVARAAQGRGENVEAHRLFLQGRQLVTRHSIELMAPAISHLTRAVEIDPGHAMAWAWLSRAQAQQAGWGQAPVKEGNERAHESAKRALELEPSLAEGRIALGFVQALYHFDWRGADASFRRAIQAAPANPEALSLAAVVGYQVGSRQEAVDFARRAVEADPLNSLAHGHLGRLYRWEGRYLEAEAALRKALELSPDATTWHGMLGAVLAEAGRLEEGLAETNAEPTLWGRLTGQAIIFHLLGRSDESDRALAELVQIGATDSAFQIAIVHAVRGEPDAAFEWLDRAWAQRDSGLSILLPEPGFRGLHPDPRWDAFLERVGFGVSDKTPDKTSIVVLPFANLNPDPDTEYFSDGLTDEIITDLSRVRALRVISRSSAMRLKGDERDLAAIGRELSCRYVLEGSVRRAANTLRITARLVDAASDVQLWADKYGGTLDDVFDIQEQVSRAIVDALEIELSPQEAAQLAERPIEDVRAQESYLRARSEIWSFLPGSLDRAINHLEAALQLIGDNALIYQALGGAYFQYVNIGGAVGREEEFLDKSERCVDRIFAIEPESPRGHLVLAQVQMARGDIRGSGRNLRRVLRAFPEEVLALQLYTHLLGWLGGKPDAAAPIAARLLEVDPLNAMSLLVSAMVPLFAGRFSEAVEPARRMFELDPVTPVWRGNFAMALGYAGRIDEAEALTEGLAAGPDSDVGTWWMGLCRAAWREDRVEVLRLADGPYRQVAEWDAEVPWLLASAHGAVGLKDEALLWLDRAIERGMINYPFLAEHDRYLDGIRGDARFREVMGRARRKWESLEV